MALLDSIKLYYCSTVFYRIVPGKRPWALTAQAPKLKVDSYTEKVLEWFNYPHTKAHPGCKNGTKSTCIISLSILRRDQPDSGEGCIVLQRLIASLLSFCTFSYCLQYANIVLQGKNEATDRCVWTFDVWCMVSKAHQNNCSYVSSADLPSDSLCENLWAVTRRTMKNYKTVKIGGCGYGCLPRTIQYFTLSHSTWLYYTLPHVLLGSGSFSTTLRVGVLLPVLLCTVWLSETWVIIESDGLLSSGWFIASHCLYTGSGRSYTSLYLSQNGVSWLDEKFGIRRIRCTVLWTWRSFYMYIV